MEIFLKSKILEEAMHHIDEINQVNNDEEQQRCAQHHDQFHELAANQSPVLAKGKNTIENQPHGAKRGAAREHERDEAEKSQQSPFGDNSSDEAIEDVV